MKRKSGIAPMLAAPLLALALATGCAGQQGHRILDAYAAVPGTQLAGEHSILVATTRERSDDPAEIFSGARAPAVSFARVDVSVPAVHRTGQIERPNRGRADPERHFAASQVAIYPDADRFETDLRRRIAADNGRVLVFIHGYRTHFDGAIYRATQIVHDAGYEGTPLLFSWASGGRTLDYVYDNNSATIGRDGLEETLRMLVRAGATRIDIVAHSMGNWLTMEALRQIAIAGERQIVSRLGDVVLASPDIDVDVFRSQLSRIGTPERPFFVLLSGDDRALQLSSIIAGNRPRVGDYTDLQDLASLGVVVVDLSRIETEDALNHTKFAENPIMVQMLGDRLREDDALEGGESDLAQRIERMTRGIGQTVGSAAEIVIATPLEIISVAVGR